MTETLEGLENMERAMGIEPTTSSLGSFFLACSGMFARVRRNLETPDFQGVRDLPLSDVVRYRLAPLGPWWDHGPNTGTSSLPKLDFTADRIAAIEPAAALVEYQDTRQPGLCLRVTPAGAKSWTVRYRTKEGARKRISLGAYPALPVSIARKNAAKIVGAVAEGEDPVKQQKTARVVEARQKLETVEAVGQRYLTEAAIGRHRMNGKPMRAGSMRLESEYFNGVVSPRLGKRRLVDLTRADIQAFVNDVETDRSPSAARHSRNVLQRIFAFAFWQDIVTSDPMRFVSAPTWKERERVLTDDELRAVWRGLDAAPAMEEVSISKAMTIAIKLAAVTLQRRGEVVGMAAEEIDRTARVWTIPGERTKNGRMHIVPLPDVAIELIDEALRLRVGRARESRFVFASPRDPEKSIGPMALTHAWRRLTPHLSISAATEKDPKRTKPLAGITPHDLRRTGATAITSERIGMPRFTVSQLLNHTSDSGGSAAVTSIYDRNAYMREKRAALEAWTALLLEIVSGAPRASNVIPLTSGAAT